MTKLEIKKMLSLLQAAYPNTYRNMSMEEKRAQLMLYENRFKEYPVEVVTRALENYIDKNEYAPSIAGLKREIKFLMPNPVDVQGLWNELERACARGTVFTKEDFEKLSKPLQKWLKNPAQVRELALLPSEIFQTVTRGQFLKTIDAVVEREEAQEALPDNVKELLKGIKFLGGGDDI